MAIGLIGDLTEAREAFFENNEADGEDQGNITWLKPTQHPNEMWLITFQGYDVQGTTIGTTTVDYPKQATLPTPGQVFWWVAQKLKSTLCPSCV